MQIHNGHSCRHAVFRRVSKSQNFVRFDRKLLRLRPSSAEIGDKKPSTYRATNRRTYCRSGTKFWHLFFWQLPRTLLFQNISDAHGQSQCIRKHTWQKASMREIYNSKKRRTTRLVQAMKYQPILSHRISSKLCSRCWNPNRVWRWHMVSLPALASIL